MSDSFSDVYPYRGQKAKLKFSIEAVMGDIKDFQSVQKFGSVVAPGTTTDYEVWTGGIAGGFYPWPTTATFLEAISLAAGDTLLGSGAQRIGIQGLGEDWKYQTAYLNMNGVTETPATLVKFFRVFRAWVEWTGAYGGKNLGQIDIQAEGGGDVLAIIPIEGGIARGISQTEMTHFTIEAGTKAVIRNIVINVDAAKKASVWAWQRQNADIVSGNMSAIREILHRTGIVGQVEPAGTFGPFPGKTDIWFSTQVGSNDTDVTIDYQIVSKPDNESDD